MKVLSAITFTTAGMPQIVAWNPGVLGSNLTGWFKADAGVTQTNSSVSSWLDQAASPATLATSTAQTSSQTAAPVLTSLSVGKANTGIVFQGATSGEVLSASASKFAFASSQAFSVGVAVTYNSSNLVDAFVSYSQATASVGWLLSVINGKLNFGFYVNSGGSNANINWSGPALTKGNSYIIVVSYPGGGGAPTIYVNGSVVTLTASGSLPSYIAGTQYLQIGGGGFESVSGSANGVASTSAVGEVVIANIALSQAQAASLSQYMDGRYSIY